MNSGEDQSAALASLLAILSQSTQKNASTSFQPPNHSTHPPLSAHVEPIFPEGDILETTQWIGIPTTSWYEPRTWQLPRPDPTIGRPQIRPPPVKRKRSPSPIEFQSTSSPATTGIASFSSYSHALKHVIQLTRSEQFISSIRRMKDRQDDLESDLFEQRSGIIRKYESKRKMNELIKSLGSKYTDEQV
jgi:hypothetical protein